MSNALGSAFQASELIDYIDAAGKPHKTLACYTFAWDGSFISCKISGSNYAD
jgi:hypothetical protein